MSNSFEEKIFGEEVRGEIGLLYCGRRIKNARHSYPPHTSDRYILTLAVEGEAVMTLADGKKIVLKAGDFYVIYPKSGARYETSVDTPWSIKWLVASGAAVESYLSLVGFSREEPVRSLASPLDIEALFDRLFLLFSSYTPSDRLLCLSLTYRLFSLLAEQGNRATVGDAMIGDALCYLEAHYTEEIGVGELAARYGYHPNYFIKRFKAAVGCTPGALLTRFRLDRAHTLLAHSEGSVGEIAVEVGFSDPLYFSRAFRARYGLSPTAYRRSLLYPI